MKSTILASGLNINLKENISSPKMKILYWKPDKYEMLKKAAKWKVEDEIPEEDFEEENSDMICDEGVKAQITDWDILGASVIKSWESLDSSISD